MPWIQTGAIHYHAQLEIQDKGRTIKKGGCLLCSMAMIYDL